MKTLILSLLAILCFTITIQSQTAGLWTGTAADESWNNGLNWDDGSVPDNTVDVVIPSGCTYYPLLTKELVVGSAFVSGNINRCKSLDLQQGANFFTKEGLTVNGSVTLNGWYRYYEHYQSGTHVVNSGGSIVIGTMGYVSIGEYDFPGNPALWGKQDLIINSGGSIINSGYLLINDCLIINSGATFNMSAGECKVYGWEAAYNATYPGSFYVASGATGGVTGGTFSVSGEEVTSYYAFHILESGFDFSTGSNLNFWNEGDQSSYGDFEVYTVSGVDLPNVQINTQGSVVTAKSNLEIKSHLVVEIPSCFTIPTGITVNVSGDFKLAAFNTMNEMGIYSSLIDAGTLNVSGTYFTPWNFTGNKWHFMSAPVANQTANLFLGQYLMNFTESTNTYSYITSTSAPLNVMEGYSVWFPNYWTNQIDFGGPTNTGISGSTNNLTNQSQGWNLVGNPYPSAIDWDASSGWTKTGVANSIYVYNNGNWASYVNGIGTNGGTRFISPCQGFFVKATTHPATLIMNNDVRIHQKPAFFKSEIGPFVRLKVTFAEEMFLYDETVIYFSDNATHGFDPHMDAEKLFADDEAIPQICSSYPELSINALPFLQSVNMNFYAGVSGYYTINVSEVTNLKMTHLEDKLTGDVIDLSIEDYTFYFTEGDIPERFVIHFDLVHVDELQIARAKVYSSESSIFIKPGENMDNSGRNTAAAVYNLHGQKITDVDMSAKGTTVVKMEVPGYYVVRINSKGSIISEKVLVR